MNPRASFIRVKTDTRYKVQRISEQEVARRLAEGTIEKMFGKQRLYQEVSPPPPEVSVPPPPPDLDSILDEDPPVKTQTYHTRDLTAEPKLENWRSFKVEVARSLNKDARTVTKAEVETWLAQRAEG
jgi:hypothetical protein